MAGMSDPRRSHHSSRSSTPNPHNQYFKELREILPNFAPGHFTKLRQLCKDHNVKENPFRMVTWYSNESCCLHNQGRCRFCERIFGSMKRTNTSAAALPRQMQAPITDDWSYFCNYGFPTGTEADADQTRFASGAGGPAHPALTQQQGQLLPLGLPAPSLSSAQPAAPAPPGMVTVKALYTQCPTGPEIVGDEAYVFPFETRVVSIQFGIPPAVPAVPARLSNVPVQDFVNRITGGGGGVQLELEYGPLWDRVKIPMDMAPCMVTFIKQFDGMAGGDCKPKIIVRRA
ncbi:hypothetical protein LTR36_008446 [Oleoguttula mirabilis]|uniref:Uncharacterized protein n=1 Tax=Oleoguttula mirabilis TaxID=1507867 RepID=A0AAV9J8A0_9PEZI|nr:hypothetical protein LTR36_008446 [Oleoguttula mirabilis]